MSIKKFVIGSRFATQMEATSVLFMKINRILDQLSVKYDLPDHSDFNQQRYPWAELYLSKPAFYAARLWEYPFAILSAELNPKMKVLDVGCGMNPLTLYLQQIAKCTTYGLDPDFFPKGIKLKCHGVSREYLEKTGLHIIQAGMENIPFPNNYFDRIFCISVIEHVKQDQAAKGMQEMARILKNNGRLIMTIDVNLLTNLCQPLDLIWESGLLPYQKLDLRWPYKRFGIFCDELQPADVFGLVLYKDAYKIQKRYQQKKGILEIPAWKIPILRQNFIQKLNKITNKTQTKLLQQQKYSSQTSSYTHAFKRLVNNFFHNIKN